MSFAVTASHRPMLKIVERTQVVQSGIAVQRVRHDERGNAFWSEAVSLEDTGELKLESEPAAQAPDDGDPYNRGAGRAPKPR